MVPRVWHITLGVCSLLRPALLVCVPVSPLPPAAKCLPAAALDKLGRQERWHRLVSVALSYLGLFAFVGGWCLGVFVPNTWLYLFAAAAETKQLYFSRLPSARASCNKGVVAVTLVTRMRAAAGL